METFSIQEILTNEINNLKKDCYESNLFNKVDILFKIWLDQKDLLFQYKKLECFEKEVPFIINDIRRVESKKDYKSQYISFLMETGLIFIEEQKDKPEIVLTLIYYWLIKEVNIDKKSLSAF